MIERFFIKIETALLGRTWAVATMTSLERLKFYRDTGEWPGIHSRITTEMFLQGDIDAERFDSKTYCADKKMARAKEAGLNIE